MESKKVYFLTTNRIYAFDAVRSALGLAVENQYAYVVFMEDEYPNFSDYIVENIDWIRDMEGEAYTTSSKSPEGVELKTISLEELGEALREADFIVPFGLTKQSVAAPPNCS